MLRRALRVLHVMEATIGGTRRHICDVTRGELARGLEVHLCAADLRERRFGRDLEQLERAGVRVARLPMVREIRPALDFQHWRRIQALIDAVRPDVVHTHSSKAGVLGRLASMNLEIGARVHTPHTFAFLFKDMFGPLRRALFFQIEAALCAATQRIVAVSATEADTFRRSGVVPIDRIRVVPNGIDPEPWRAALPADLEPLGVPRGAPVACAAGLLNVAKGPDLAVRALARPGCGGLHLLLAGHGELRVPLEELACDLGVEDRVHFAGWREDLPSVLKACDFLVLPSRWEGMPYIVLEAMAAGVPVVAARVDGARELVADGQSGYLCDVDSEQDLAQCMRRMLEHAPAERRAMGAEGSVQLAERWSQERMVEGLIDVYREVL